MTERAATAATEIIDERGAGRRSDHGSSADAYEGRERALATADQILRRDQPVGPLVIAEQAKAMEAAFQALCEAVLDPSEDYALYQEKHQVLENGRIVEVSRIVRRKKKSAWRKLARYFNLDVVILREVIGHRHVEGTCARVFLAKAGLSLQEGEDCGCPTVYARYHIKVVAPNGRVGFGVGIASINERSFKAQDHSLPATAFSRAVSRASSDMIGAGESGSDDPAETADSDERKMREARPARPEGAGGALTTEQANAYTAAWKAATEDRKAQVKRYMADEELVGTFLTAGAGAPYEEVMRILGAASDAPPE
jgi:hypothetical protein